MIIRIFAAAVAAVALAAEPSFAASAMPGSAQGHSKQQHYPVTGTGPAMTGMRHPGPRAHSMAGGHMAMGAHSMRGGHMGMGAHSMPGAHMAASRPHPMMGSMHGAMRVKHHRMTFMHPMTLRKGRMMGAHPMSRMGKKPVMGHVIHIRTTTRHRM